MTNDSASALSDENSTPPPMYFVTFERHDGVHEWWGLYFLELEEADRWARYELHQRRHRVGRWIAQIDVMRWIDEASDWRDVGGGPVARLEL